MGMPLYIHAGPIKSSENEVNLVHDRHNHPISFYPHVPEILHTLKELSLIVAICSRTGATEVAHQALSNLRVPPSHTKPDGANRAAILFFDQKEIYPGSKIWHFNQLHAKTGIAYEDMLFFDDEHRNKEVAELGVTFILVKRGMNNATFKRGLEEWRRQHPASPSDSDAEAVDAKAN